MATSLLATAVKKKNWDLVALCLLIGVVEEAARLPPETLESLLELLELPHHDARNA